MTPDSRTNGIKVLGPIVLSAMAVLLAAAATGYDANRERLRGLPPDQRERLLGNLRRFDLELTPEQQTAARALDSRLAEMIPEQRAQYLAALRRYHDWLNSLPENRQDELSAKPAGERMALVRKLIAEWRVPIGDTPLLMGVVEPGGLSVFELASAYKIWQELPADERTAIEQRVNQDRARREELFRRGSRLKPPIPRETRPDDYDEEKRIGLVQEHLKKDRPLLAGDAKADEASNDPAALFRHNVLRRRAINLFVREARGVRAVTPDRLVRFVSTLPGWIQSTLDPLPPDEARRRLTVAYRLVFGDKEIGAVSRSAHPGAATKVQPAPAARSPAPERPKGKAVQPGGSDAPF
jgi:hypothetical protein